MLRTKLFAIARIAGPAALALTAFSLPARAQVSTFQTPGQPMSQLTYGQVDRFTTGFNPAIAFVIDSVGDWTYVDFADGGSNQDFDLQLRAFELATAAWIDPKAWAYAIIVADEDEIELEEAAVNYQGFDSNLTLRAGRFFADFGKQMQFHVHDLRTLDRPAVLASYLGEELAGTGVQLDNWFPVGDETVVRYSLGVFATLGGEGHHDEEEDEEEVETLARERRNTEELGLTGRLTGFKDVGERGILQLGLSARHTPEFDLEYDPSGDSAGNLTNTVVGADVTWGWTDETGIKRWTIGGEALLLTGDIGAELDDNLILGDPSDDLIQVVDDTVVGMFAFADRAWSQWDSAGFQVSWFERPEGGSPYTAAYDVYYTRFLTEFQRLRLGVGYIDEEDGDDSLRVALQYTIMVGPHAHGVNF